MKSGQTTLGILLVIAGLACGLTAVFMDMLCGAQSLMLVSSGIALIVIGFMAPLFRIETE